MLLAPAKINSNADLYTNSIYNGISDMLIVLNESVEIQTVNVSAVNSLGFAEEELMNQSIGLLIQKNDFDLVRDTIRNAYYKKSLHEAGLNLVAKDKNIIPCSCTFSPLFNEYGTLTGILLVAKNISKLIDAQRQLQDKNDELNLFVYKASHDLKSPVSSIKGLMTLLKKSNNPGDIQTYHHLIDDGIGKLEAVIDDLMILGRITYNELKLEEINIKFIIGEILKSIQFAEGYDDITFKISIDDDANNIACEKGLFTTVLYNLIDNAIKYRKKRAVPSLVKIKVIRTGAGITVKIEDNGIGIDERHQANVFKMFYRANNISKGTGLGLYIVKMGIMKLGGEISFTSRPKEGTCFTMYVPGQINKEKLTT